MEFYWKLPRSKKEFALFILIISVISVNIIAPLITCFEFGFHLAVWADVLRIIPFMWMAVVAQVLITYVPAEKMTACFTKEGDSFSAHLAVNILCTVFILSIILTVVGTWIGSRHISPDPIIHFFYKWPRNFAISLGVEMVIAQPIARSAMFALHRAQAKKKGEEIPKF